MKKRIQKLNEKDTNSGMVENSTSIKVLNKKRYEEDYIKKIIDLQTQVRNPMKYDWIERSTLVINGMKNEYGFYNLTKYIHSHMKVLLRECFRGSSSCKFKLWRKVNCLWEENSSAIQKSIGGESLIKFCSFLLSAVIDLGTITRYATPFTVIKIEERLAAFDAMCEYGSLDVLLQCKTLIHVEHRKPQVFLPAFKYIVKRCEQSSLDERQFLKFILLLKQMSVFEKEGHKGYRKIYHSCLSKLSIPANFIAWAEHNLECSFNENVGVAAIVEEVDFPLVYKTLFPDSECVAYCTRKKEGRKGLSKKEGETSEDNKSLNAGQRPKNRAQISLLPDRKRKLQQEQHIHHLARSGKSLLKKKKGNRVIRQSGQSPELVPKASKNAPFISATTDGWEVRPLPTDLKTSKKRKRGFGKLEKRTEGFSKKEGKRSKRSKRMNVGEGPEIPLQTSVRKRKHQQEQDVRLLAPNKNKILQKGKRTKQSAFPQEGISHAAPKTAPLISITTTTEGWEVRPLPADLKTSQQKRKRKFHMTDHDLEEEEPRSRIPRVKKMRKEPLQDPREAKVSKVDAEPEGRREQLENRLRNIPPKNFKKESKRKQTTSKKRNQQDSSRSDFGSIVKIEGGGTVAKKKSGKINKGNELIRREEKKSGKINEVNELIRLLRDKNRCKRKNDASKTNDSDVKEAIGSGASNASRSKMTINKSNPASDTNRNVEEKTVLGAVKTKKGKKNREKKGRSIDMIPKINAERDSNKMRVNRVLCEASKDRAEWSRAAFLKRDAKTEKKNRDANGEKGKRNASEDASTSISADNTLKEVCKAEQKGNEVKKESRRKRSKPKPIKDNEVKNSEGKGSHSSLPEKVTNTELEMKQKASVPRESDSDSDLEILEVSNVEAKDRASSDPCSESEADEASGSDEDIAHGDEEHNMFTEQETREYHTFLTNQINEREREKIKLKKAELKQILDKVPDMGKKDGEKLPVNNAQAVKKTDDQNTKISKQSEEVDLLQALYRKDSSPEPKDGKMSEFSVNSNTLPVSQIKILEGEDDQDPNFGEDDQDPNYGGDDSDDLEVIYDTIKKDLKWNIKKEVEEKELEVEAVVAPVVVKRSPKPSEDFVSRIFNIYTKKPAFEEPNNSGVDIVYDKRLSRGSGGKGTLDADGHPATHQTKGNFKTRNTSTATCAEPVLGTLSKGHCEIKSPQMSKSKTIRRSSFQLENNSKATENSVHNKTRKCSRDDSPLGSVGPTENVDDNRREENDPSQTMRNVTAAKLDNSWDCNEVDKKPFNSPGVLSSSSNGIAPTKSSSKTTPESNRKVTTRSSKITPDILSEGNVLEVELIDEDEKESSGLSMRLKEEIGGCNALNEAEEKSGTNPMKDSPDSLHFRDRTPTVETNDDPAFSKSNISHAKSETRSSSSKEVECNPDDTVLTDSSCRQVLLSESHKKILHFDSLSEESLDITKPNEESVTSSDKVSKPTNSQDTSSERLTTEQDKIDSSPPMEMISSPVANNPHDFEGQNKTPDPERVMSKIYENKENIMHNNQGEFNASPRLKEAVQFPIKSNVETRLSIKSPLKSDATYLSPKKFAGAKKRTSLESSAMKVIGNLTPQKVADAALTNEVVISPNVSDEENVAHSRVVALEKDFSPEKELEAESRSKLDKDSEEQVIDSCDDVGRANSLSPIIPLQKTETHRINGESLTPERSPKFTSFSIQSNKSLTNSSEKAFKPSIHDSDKKTKDLIETSASDTIPISTTPDTDGPRINGDHSEGLFPANKCEPSVEVVEDSQSDDVLKASEERDTVSQSEERDTVSQSEERDTVSQSPLKRKKYMLKRLGLHLSPESEDAILSSPRRKQNSLSSVQSESEALLASPSRPRSRRSSLSGNVTPVRRSRRLSGIVEDRPRE